MVELPMWLATAASLKAQRGCLIYRCSGEGLKTIIDELTEDQLFSEDSGQVVVKHMKNAVAEFQDRWMPSAF
eukprot:7946851-Pyramimonas_sp.AAC.1